MLRAQINFIAYGDILHITYAEGIEASHLLAACRYTFEYEGDIAATATFT